MMNYSEDKKYTKTISFRVSDADHYEIKLAAMKLRQPIKAFVLETLKTRIKKGV
jgi:predicted HicB family RNase H-like nuclease